MTTRKSVCSVLCKGEREKAGANCEQTNQLTSHWEEAVPSRSMCVCVLTAF